MKAIVDCNSFYCSCERLFRPDLWNKPVVVLSNNDGCIVSRSDEAKALGIAMASPYFQQKDLIKKHGVAVFSSNYNLYGELSRRVMDTLRCIIGEDKTEVYSVDEAFLDFDAVPENEYYARAVQIRETVETWTGIKVSVGAGPTKVLSKLANRLAKKDKRKTGCVMVLDTADKIEAALRDTHVRDLWGVGRRYAAKLQEEWGICDAWQLRNMPLPWAGKYLGGVTGLRMVRELRGEACIPIREPLDKKKMIATTRMFGQPVLDLKDIREAVATYTSRAAEKLRRQHCAAGSMTVFVVTNDRAGGRYSYEPATKNSYTLLPKATSVTGELISHALPLAEKLYRKGSHYIKAGVILGTLVPDESVQENLFACGSAGRHRELMDVMDNINFSLGMDSLKYGSTGLTRNWKMRQEARSPRYTCRWDELPGVR